LDHLGLIRRVGVSGFMVLTAAVVVIYFISFRPLCIPFAVLQQELNP
jgi:hypothetical protein